MPTTIEKGKTIANFKTICTKVQAYGLGYNPGKPHLLPAALMAKYSSTKQYSMPTMMPKAL